MEVFEKGVFGLFGEDGEEDDAGEAKLVPLVDGEAGRGLVEGGELIVGCAGGAAFVEMPGDSAEGIVEGAGLEVGGLLGDDFFQPIDSWGVFAGFEDFQEGFSHGIGKKRRMKAVGSQTS